MQQNSELSVEEILESIKKVIARDNRETAQVERQRREHGGMVLRELPVAPKHELISDNEDEYEDEDEVLELGVAAEELIVDEGEADEVDRFDLSLADTAPVEETSAQTIEAVLDLSLDESSALDESSPVEAADSSPETAEMPSEPEAQVERVNEPTEALAGLAAHSPANPSSVSDTPESTHAAEAGNEAPLERMVREMLRPMIADWLDTNLPPIVERLLIVEIERISGKSH